VNLLHFEQETNVFGTFEEGTRAGGVIKIVRGDGAPWASQSYQVLTMSRKRSIESDLVFVSLNQGDYC
jgi:hypothetical protein